MDFTQRFRHWLRRPLSRTEHLLVNAFEIQRALAGYVRFYISDSGTRGNAIRCTLILYMRYIAQSVYPCSGTAVVARTLTEARRTGIPRSVHASAFAVSRLRGLDFTHALILDAASYPRSRTHPDPDPFAPLAASAIAAVPLSGSVVIIHGDAFVRGHSAFKYAFYRAVRSAPSRFIAVAATAPVPPMSRRRTADFRIDTLAQVTDRTQSYPASPRRKPLPIWQRPEAELRDFYSHFCRHDMSWHQFLERIRSARHRHSQSDDARLKELRRTIREMRRKANGYEPRPSVIPTLGNLAAHPALLCLAPPAAKARHRFSPLSQSDLIRLSLGQSSPTLAKALQRTLAVDMRNPAAFLPAKHTRHIRRRTNNANRTPRTPIPRTPLILLPNTPRRSPPVARPA